MIWLAMVGAATLSLANTGSIITPLDYPVDALGSERSAAALLELVVNPSGHIERCSVLSVVGDPGLAARMCAIVQHRKLPPATMRDGTRTYARIRSLFRMIVPQTEQGDEVARITQSPGQVLMIANPPAGMLGRPADLALAVDATGQVIDCAPAAPSKNADVAALACQVRSSLTVEPLVLSDGRRPPFVSSLRVTFEAAAN